MVKENYHDTDKIVLLISEATTLGVDNDQDLTFFIKQRTGYDVTPTQLKHYKRKFKEEGAIYTTWLENFARNKVLQTASSHLQLEEEIRNDLYKIYRKKRDRYIKHLDEETEPDPLELTELLDVKKELEATNDHIEKRHLALLFILPVKVSLDKKDNKVKLENSDPNTRNAILVADYQAEQLEANKKRLADLTEIHGEENTIA